MNFKKIESSLRKLSEKDLNLKTKKLAKQEQELNLTVLYHLQEVFRRKYFAKLGYSSVWEYCVKELGYCEAGASHRIQAMKLMFTNESAKQEIERNNLSLSQAVKISQFLTREKKETGKTYLPMQTSQLIAAVKNKSVRETIQHLQQVERKRKAPLLETAKTQTVCFEADEELIEMMKRMRELKGNLETNALMKLVFRQTLSRIDPLRKSKRTKSKSIPSEPKQSLKTYQRITNPTTLPKQSLNTYQEVARYPKPVPGLKSVPPTSKSTHQDPHTAKSTHRKPSRYIPKHLKTQVARRSNGQCEFISPITQKRCQSRYRIQIDHAKPLSRGGKTTSGNLQHLCPAHNATKGRQEKWYFKPEFEVPPQQSLNLN